MDFKASLRIATIFQLLLQVFCLYENISLRKIKTNHFSSVHAACTRDAIVVITTMQQPFHGKIYAKGYPTACHVVGNSTRDVKLIINVKSCGVKIFESSDQKLVYEVYVYIQYDQTVQLVNDEQILVSCNPVDVIMLSSTPDATSKGPLRRLPTARQLHDPELIPKQMGRSAASALEMESEMEAALSAKMQLPTIHTWMDILNGKTIDGNQIHDFISVGEEATMLIKIPRKTGLDTRVVNCIAHDGSGESQQELIDNNGCAVEASIMPNLHEKVNTESDLKLIYAPFAAFKFPERDHLHLKCQVIVCNKECPMKHLCNSRTGRLFGNQISRVPNDREANWQRLKQHGNILDIVEVFNSFEVKAPQIELDPLNSDDFNTNDMEPRKYRDDTTCLSTSKMILTFGILLGILLIALVFSLSMFVWSRNHQSIPRKWVQLSIPRSCESYS